jgi:hypothetical protein
MLQSPALKETAGTALMAGFYTPPALSTAVQYSRHAPLAGFLKKTSFTN